jgi:hypothetical protein
MCQLLNGKLSQFENGSPEQGIDHHPNAMSSNLGRNSRHQSLSTLCVVLGEMQLLLQLRVDRFAQEPQPIELLLRRLGTHRRLVHLDRSKDGKATILLEKLLQICIIVRAISQQTLEVMRKGVQQFHHGLIVIGTGWGEQEAHDDSRQADHTMEFAAKVLQGFAATDSIVGSPYKITVLFGAFIPNAGDGGRVNDCCLGEIQRIEDDLQAHPNRQDHRPQIPFATVIAAAFIEIRKKRPQMDLMQSEKWSSLGSPISS